MTRAIEQLKQAMEVCELGALSLPDQIDALMDTGKAVLQEVSTLTPPNEPLTFAELREMEGEPVWVEHNNGGEWLIIHWDYVGRITTAHKACLLDYEYGRTWLTYRHPLEGEANG